MYFRKKGLPDEGELVFCEVSKVRYNSVFCNIEEYGGRTGLIHISEISPGRIRNIRDYVKEGKWIVCKVIKTDEEKGHVDLSLRRVTEIEKRNKINERKQELKAEKIIDSLAAKIDKKGRTLYFKIAEKILPDYEMIHYAFQDVVENDVSLKKLGIDKEYADRLEELVKEKIKPKTVTISGDLEIKTWAENGVETVKKALQQALNQGGKIDITYLGSGKYSVIVEAKKYKKAEKELKNALDSAKKIVATTEDYKFNFERKKR